MADSKYSASCFMGFGPKKLADGFASETGPFRGGADSEQHDQHVLDWVAYWMANVKIKRHTRASLPMNSLPKCSGHGEAEAQGEGAKAGSFEMPPSPEAWPLTSRTT
jgi:hypothetical protein